MYSPPAEPVWPMVNPIVLGYGFLPNATGTAPTSGTFESANRAVYYPVAVPGSCVVRRLWWANGSSVSASYNVDCGVYADDGYKPGAKLVSTGSTAQGTASQVQFVDVTDTTLQPGLYWLALSCSSQSATIFRTSLTDTAGDALFRFEEASAVPLPASATPVESTGTVAYLFGFATTASP